MPAGKWFDGGASWRLAFLLSAAVHAFVLLGLSSLPGPSVGHSVAHADAPCLSVCDIADEEGDAATFIFPHPETKKAEPARPDYQSGSVDTPLFNPKLVAPTAAANAATQAPQSGTAPSVGAGKAAAFGQAPAGASGQGHGGKSFFSLPIQGQRVVYVIDRSSSMGRQQALTVAKRELLASLNSLPASTQFQIIVFNSVAHPLIPAHADWFPVTPPNLALVQQALAALEATNGTVHDRALLLALALQPDVIFFLTDADDLDPRYLDDITRRNQNRAAIHVIELNTNNRNHPDMPLQLFARQNRGIYQAVDVISH